jgi:hypothetical protein
MSFKSDVKAIRRNTTGVVFAGRTRLRGIILGAPNSTEAGSVILVNGGTTTTYFQADAPAGDVFAFNIPEDGVLFENGMSISSLTGTVTVLLDK